MDKIDLILWILGAGFSLMLVAWGNLHKRIDGIENSLSKKIDGLESSLGNRIDKLDEKLTDVNRRLCRMEGAMTAKDCCMLKSDQQLRKAE